MSHCITFPGDLGQHATGDAPPGFKELLSLALQGSQLHYQESMKYLGITFDQKMTFSSHLSQKTTEARRRLNVVRRTTRTF